MRLTDFCNQLFTRAPTYLTDSRSRRSSEGLSTLEEGAWFSHAGLEKLALFATSNVNQG